MPIASLTQADGGYALDTPFDRTFLDAFKATVPYSDRRWDGARKRWIIAHEKAPEICRLVEQHFGVRLPIPQSGPARAAEPRVPRVEYVGRSRMRDDGKATATGFCDGSWSLVFPESVLRAWFGVDGLSDPQAPVKPQTLYAVLNVAQSATADEIKRAYRRLVIHTHPDHNREPDAREQFDRLQHAYEVLRDEKTRKRYNAGLALETSYSDPRPFGRPKNMAVHRHDDQTLGYRSPLRCGMLVVEGTPRVGQFVVSKILKWDDVVDAQGRTMVSSWGLGGDTFEVRWF